MNAFTSVEDDRRIHRGASNKLELWSGWNPNGCCIRVVSRILCGGAMWFFEERGDAVESDALGKFAGGLHSSMVWAISIPTDWPVLGWPSTFPQSRRRTGG